MEMDGRTDGRVQGEVVASCGEKELAIAVAEVDVGYMDQIRANMPVFTHRRDDIYGPILSGPILLDHHQHEEEHKDNDKEDKEERPM